MESRSIKFLPIKVYTDDIYRFTFVRGFDDEQYFSIKLPTELTKFKQANLINPCYLLDVDIIKTRKNWILKNINSYTKVLELSAYKDYQKLSQIVSVIDKAIYRDQSIKVLDQLLELIPAGVESKDISDFEAKLLYTLGFSPRSGQITESQLQTIKNANNLEI